MLLDVVNDLVYVERYVVSLFSLKAKKISWKMQIPTA
jgi:hypothetical protein